MNSFSFEEKDPRFTRLKPDLALRLLGKGLFYIRATVLSEKKFSQTEHFFIINKQQPPTKHQTFIAGYKQKPNSV